MAQGGTRAKPNEGAKPQRGVHRTQRGRAEKCKIRRGWSRCAWPARPGDGPLALATLPHAANPRLERPQQPLRRRHVRTYRSGGGTRRSARALALGPRRGKRTGWPPLELADASLERAASGGTSGALDSSDSSLRARVPEQGTRRLKEIERAVDRRSARGRRPPSASPTRRARTRAARRRRRRPTRPRMSLSTDRRPRRPTQGSASATAAKSRGAASRGPSPRWRRGRRRAAARLETGNAASTGGPGERGAAAGAGTGAPAPPNSDAWCSSERASSRERACSSRGSSSRSSSTATCLRTCREGRVAGVCGRESGGVCGDVRGGDAPEQRLAVAQVAVPHPRRRVEREGGEEERREPVAHKVVEPDAERA